MQFSVTRNEVEFETRVFDFLGLAAHQVDNLSVNPGQDMIQILKETGSKE